MNTHSKLVVRRRRRIVGRTIATFITTVTVILCADASLVRAQSAPTVNVTGVGSCPSPAQVAAQLKTWMEVSTGTATQNTPPPWSVHIVSAAEGAKQGIATLELVDTTGRVRMTRQLESRDCPAAAQVFAFMVQAFFIEIHLLPPPTSVAAAATPQASTSVATKPAHVPAAGPGAMTREEAGAYALGGALGLIWSEPSSWQSSYALPLAANVHASWRAHSGLGVRTSVDAALPRTQSRFEEEVSLTQLSFAVQGAYTLDWSRWWTTIAIGGGAALRWAQATTRPRSQVHLDVDPTAVFTADVGRVIGRHWSVYAGVTSTVFFTRHNYRVEPLGVIATSPTFECGLSLGVEWRESL